MTGRFAQTPRATPDILLAGDVAPGEFESFSADGLDVQSAPSIISAMARLGQSGARLVVADGGAVAGREHAVFQSLRKAGARRILAVFPPAEAHRADRADCAGADAAIALPAYPGRLESLARGLLAESQHPTAASPQRVAVRTTARATTSPPPPSRAAPAGPPPSHAAPRSEEPSAHQIQTPAALPARLGSRTDGASMEALVGDIAVINRSVNDLERLLDQAVSAFIRRSGAGRCSIMLREQASGRDELYVRKTSGLPDTGTNERVSVGEGPSGRVALTGEPLLVGNVERHPDAPAWRTGRSHERTYQTGSFLILPLRAAEGVLGVVCLADKISGRPFDQEDQRSLLFLANHVAQALENALKFSVLSELSVVDELTGLYNRRHFDRALDREIQRARRYDRQLSLALLDLDHFKTYNDLCGHPAGDRALASVGEILRTQLREVDIVVRYGGEEFAVILPETNARPSAGASNPFPFLDRLRQAIESTVFPGEERMPSGCLTVSGGVACFPDDADGTESLLEAADRALYDAKEQGKNRIVYRGQSLTAS